MNEFSLKMLKHEKIKEWGIEDIEDIEDINSSFLDVFKEIIDKEENKINRVNKKRI